MTPLPTPLRRLAVLRANGLGDLVISEPALAALRAAHPDAEITLLGSAAHRALLAGRPGPVDRVVEVPSVPGVRDASDRPDTPAAEVEAWCAEQRAHGYDLAVQMHGGGRNSNALLARLGAAATAGTATEDAPRPDHWVPYRPYQHDTMRWLELAAALGAPAVHLEPRLSVTDADRAASHAALPPGERPLAVLHPGATDARRCYPEERLGVVAQDLADAGARVVLVGAGGDADRVERVAAAMRSPAECLVGTLGLAGLVGTLARAALVVGNDSGPRHLAGAVGTPTVAVFTVANLIDAAPLHRVRHRALVSLRSGCRVCGRHVLDGWCGHGASCTHDVPLDDVRAAALDLWTQSLC